MDVLDAVAWWYDHRKAYPRLSRMALYYLTIPGMCSMLPLDRPIVFSFVNFPTATSVDVERIFSHGRLLLTHVRNRLSAQTTRALICLRWWIPLNLVKTSDVLRDVSKMEDVPDGEEDQEMEDGWDRIRL